MTQSKEQNEYWDYIPDFLSPELFAPLYIKIAKICGLNGSRLSCVFSSTNTSNTNNTNDNNYYSKTPLYNWSEAPKEVLDIKKSIEEYTQIKFDYVLLHIYVNGKSSIGYHSDSEAMNSTVVSISLGSTRKFRFKSILPNNNDNEEKNDNNEKKKPSWDHELLLNSGDMLIMHGPRDGKVGCQSAYLHTVPIERKVKTPRINLTFRCFE